MGSPAPTEPVMPQEWGADTRIVTPGTRRDYLERREGESEATRVGTASALRRDGFMQAEEWDLPKPEGRYRVFCFGGSATLGVPVEREPERTFPGQLEGLLTREGLDAEVINLGVERSRACSSAAGRVSRTAVPFPGALSISIWPPYRPTIP